MGTTIRLLAPAASASPSPAIGQALGPLGVNMMEFCKVSIFLLSQFSTSHLRVQAFNAQTSHLKEGIPIPVHLTANDDRTFTFRTKVSLVLGILYVVSKPTKVLFRRHIRHG